jgi:hypothetical protein
LAEKKDPTPGDLEARKKATEAWLKRQKELQRDVDEARIAMARGLYFDLYFLLFGFLFVAAGSLGYIASETPFRRIFGAALLGGMLILVIHGVSGGVGRVNVPSRPVRAVQ